MNPPWPPPDTERPIRIAAPYAYRRDPWWSRVDWEELVAVALGLGAVAIAAVLMAAVH